MYFFLPSSYVSYVSFLEYYGKHFYYGMHQIKLLIKLIKPHYVRASWFYTLQKYNI